MAPRIHNNLLSDVRLHISNLSVKRAEARTAFLYGSRHYVLHRRDHDPLRHLSLYQGRLKARLERSKNPIPVSIELLHIRGCDALPNGLSLPIQRHLRYLNRIYRQ